MNTVHKNLSSSIPLFCQTPEFNWRQAVFFSSAFCMGSYELAHLCFEKEDNLNNNSPIPHLPQTQQMKNETTFAGKWQFFIQTFGQTAEDAPGNWAYSFGQIIQIASGKCSFNQRTSQLTDILVYLFPYMDWQLG